MEQSTVNQRLNLIVDTFEKGIKAAFARKAGISPQGAQEILAGRKGDPSFKVLVKILESYPALNANWLVLGRGPMLQGEVTEAVESTSSTLPAKELEEMVRQLVKNQLSERTRRLGWRRSEQREELARRLDRLDADIEWNNKIMSPSVIGRGRDTEGEWDTEFTDEQLKQEIRQYEEEAEEVRAQLNEYARADEQIRQEMRATVYRLGGEADISKPFWGMLHLRLSIPIEVAQKLVVSGKIRSVEIEGEGFRVTEQAVREFLGEA